MLTMGIEHYDQPHAIFFILEVSNAFFTTVFSLGKRSRRFHLQLLPFIHFALQRQSSKLSVFVITTSPCHGMFSIFYWCWHRYSAF